LSTWLPQKSDSHLIFADSVLVSGREQRQLLPELSLSRPEQSLSTAWAIIVRVLFWCPVHRATISWSSLLIPPFWDRADFRSLIGLLNIIESTQRTQRYNREKYCSSFSYLEAHFLLHYNSKGQIILYGIQSDIRTNIEAHIYYVLLLHKWKFI
jgi:hypothetical protein